MNVAPAPSRLSTVAAPPCAAGGLASPGYTVEVQKGTATSVRYVNALPARHLFDNEVPDYMHAGTPVRMNTHLHGAHVAGSSDGNPYAYPPEYRPGQTDADAYSAALAQLRAANPDAPNPDPTQYVTGPAAAPDANERGWKDTVRANPGQITRIRMRWTLPAGVTTPQRYVFHCHILEHEDNSMMRPLELIS